MEFTIEEKLTMALQKNPITRDRLVINILNPSIEKCVYILLRSNKRHTRLHDQDDLVQEARLTILRVVQMQDLSVIKCALRTYLLGAVKRRIWGIIREEFAVKRQAQTKAVPLDMLDQIKKIPQELKLWQKTPNNISVIEIQDLVKRIKAKLHMPEKDMFQYLIDGHTVAEVAVLYGMPLQTVYTILRRKIKPIAKRLMKNE